MSARKESLSSDNMETNENNFPRLPGTKTKKAKWPPNKKEIFKKFQVSKIWTFPLDGWRLFLDFGSTSVRSRKKLGLFSTGFTLEKVENKQFYKTKISEKYGGQ